MQTSFFKLIDTLTLTSKLKSFCLNADDIRIYFILAADEALKNNPQNAVDQLKNIVNDKYAFTYSREKIFDTIRESEVFSSYVQNLKEKLGINEQDPRP